MRERGDEAHGSFQTVLILVAIPLVGMAIFFLWQWLNGGITPEETVQEVRAATVLPKAKKPEPVAEPALPRVTRKRTKRPVAAPSSGAHKGDIVLIIDDLGFDGQPLERVMALDPNINVAILPNGTRAEEFAETLHRRGFEVLCHLPMQPRGRETPGRNAILASMTDDEIATTTRQNIEAVPYARGVNNHMGSLATADRRVMTSVIGAMPDGMYFIDSRTGGASVAATVAREMNVRTATRNVFLDDVATERAVRKQLAELAAAAEKRGVAIGIGHPYPVTLRVLADELPGLKARGFRLVRASSVVN
ncbi:MAG TPA: divergent polysaccharide deacetylase family protein [Thermoanaerobaculia bacterium]|nr:divergent polysaccharide deacetylase family protein [Thermoanaerobaculia bacterium]